MAGPGDGAPFSVTTEHVDGNAVVRPWGDVDMATADELREALHAVAAPGGTLVVDLSGVTFMDSTGLAVIASAYQALGSEREALVLRSPNELVRRLLEISGVADIVTVERPST